MMTLPAIEEAPMRRAVDSIVAVYERADVSLQQIRTMAAGASTASALTACTKLEHILQSGLEKVTTQARDGFERYGADFEHGDVMSLSAMGNLAIELQDGVLRSLTFAIEENNVGQIKTATTAAENGRMRCSLILSQFRIRLSQKGKEEADSLLDSPLESPVISPVEEAVEMLPQSPNTGTRNNSFTPTIRPGVASAKSDTSSTSDARRPAPVAESEYDDLSYLPSMKWFQRRKRSSMSSQMKRRLSFLSRRDSGTFPAEDSTCSSSPCSSSPALPSPASTYSQDTPSDADLSTDSYMSVNRGLLRLPTSKNGYLGLCRGGTDFARGDERAFTEEAEWAFGKVPFLLCSYCAFACKISRTKVWESHGVRFRWAFLAKSHVTQTKVKHGIHTYKCVFCAYSGIDSPAIQGEDAFIEHVASHRGIQYCNEMLERTKCISNRYARENEDFDINLIPLTDSPRMERQKSRSYADSWLDTTSPLSPTSTGPFGLG